MLIFPAIDLRGGRVVRLSQGDYDRMTVYSDDPVLTAQGFQAAGAACLHVVDLDGAKEGWPQNRELIGALCGLGLFVEVGGGIRNESAVTDTLALGVNRVVLGTAAVTDFGFTTRMGKRFGEQLVVGVDVKGGKVATHGWRQLTDLDGTDFCRRLVDVGISTVIYTDIAKDGLLGGANLRAYERLRRIDGLRVIASGGVSTVAELQALRELDLYGAIIGKALYAGKLRLTDALAAARGEAGAC